MVVAAGRVVGRVRNLRLPVGLRSAGAGAVIKEEVSMRTVGGLRISRGTQDVRISAC
jgi:hypothetical protein